MYRIGISGWVYPPWRGAFYPENLPRARELEYASRQLNSIEINGSFYGLQRPVSYRKWYDATPEDFVFSVKASRYITHIRRLLEPKKPLANFLASGPLALGEKLGPVLWQFPPNFRFEPGRFEEFLALLPKTLGEAAKIAKNHEAFMRGRSFTRVSRARHHQPLRHAVEVRNESFRNPELIKILRRHGVALVFADSAGKWPYFEDLCADFVYLRLHGKGKFYVGGYDEKSLEGWAKKLQLWTRGQQPRDAFVYFDNDVKVQAPFNAMTLLKRLTDFVPESKTLPRAA